MNTRRQPDSYRWDADAQRDIDRVQQLWRELRAAHGGQGPFLFGEFSIADAMFAPLAFRFRGYGVSCDEVSAAYRETLLNLPAMRAWEAESRAESESLDKYENLATP
jgi:glutathione S-transferase